MESLPPVRLGAMVLFSYLAAYAIRLALLKPVVLSAPPPGSGRQMVLDFAMGSLAGLFAMVLSMVLFSFPPLASLHLAFAFIMASFFLAMDLALYRERQVISNARSLGLTRPPARIFPVTRKFSLAATTFIVLIGIVMFLVISKDMAWLKTVEHSGKVDATMRAVAKEILFIMGVFLLLVVHLIRSYSKNLSLLFENETQVLEGVANGDLTQTVPVATNDEFGLIAGHTNTMIRGLNHRMKLLGDLKLAEEIQQNLLPEAVFEFPGLDIFGKSIYCSETGGDYFDYIRLGEDRLGVVVADASDHGVGAALYMTTARALFRSRAGKDRDLGRTTGELNRDLYLDASDTGRFMTFFYAAFNPVAKTLEWVRAGHDPALLYDPETREFEELMGRGPALGVMEAVSYETNERSGLKAGQVLVIATDGVWETQSPAGEMFGKARLKKLIAEYGPRGAEKTARAVLAAVREFRGGLDLADDVTIVVVRMV